MTKNTKSILWFILIIFLLILTRLFLFQPHFYNWDAVQLGLALTKFDIAHHRPHPPGYFLYVMLARLIYYLGFSPELTYQVLSLLMTGIGLLGLYLLSRIYLTQTWSLIVVISGLFHPYIWGYSIIGESYASEFAVTTWLGYLFILAWEGNIVALLISGLLIGLSGGIRSNIEIFMSLFFLISLYKSPSNLKYKIYSILFAVIGTGIWFIPTILNAGGLSRYLMLSHNTVMSVAKTNSLLFGITRGYALMQFKVFMVWNAILLGPMFLLVLPGFFITFMKKDQRDSKPPLWLILLLWIAPPFLFYTLIFAAKPGYLLGYFTPILIGEGALGQKLWCFLKTRNGKSFARVYSYLTGIIVIVLGSWLFLLPPKAFGLNQYIWVSFPDISMQELGVQYSLKAIQKEIQRA